MARINIDDTLYRDNRFSALCIKLGSKAMALGVLVEAWTVAQGHCEIENPRCLIPLQEWKKQFIHESVLEVGLATIEGNFVYVEGSESQFDWLLNAKLNAMKGGLKKAENARLKKESESLPKQQQKFTLATAKKPGSVPSSSLSSSDSFSKKNTEEKTRGGPAAPAAPNNLVKHYCDEWAKRYGSSPIILPRDAGQLKKFADSVGPAKAAAVITAYLSMPEPWFVKKRHDIGTMVTNLNAVQQYVNNGKILTSKTQHEMEKKIDVVQKTGRVNFKEVAEARERELASAAPKQIGGTDEHD